MAAKTRAFEVTISSDMAVFSPDTLKAYDAVCFNNTTKLVFTEEQKKALMDFVRSGKGIVGIHAATDSFYGWDEAARMMGGQFTKHPWTSDKTVTVKIDDPAHPLTKPFGGKRFRITDEIYATRPPFYGRDKQRVLMSLDMSDPSTRNVKGVTRQDYDTGISWIKRYGQGRVFYGALGHNHPICWHPAILAHYLAGIQFALGDLEADATPQPAPPAQTDMAPLETLLQKSSGYDFGRGTEGLLAIEKTIRERHGTEVNRTAMEQLPPKGPADSRIAGLEGLPVQATEPRRNRGLGRLSGPHAQGREDRGHGPVCPGADRRPQGPRPGATDPAHRACQDPDRDHLHPGGMA